MGIACVALALALCAALLWGVSLRRAVQEIARELDEKMREDTNTLISVSSGDRAVRRLAAQLNVQLRALRDERRRLQNGDAELKAAVTNAAHDLRTPLTAVSGYLDLLEREGMTARARGYLAIVRERTDALTALTGELFGYSVVSSTAGNLTPEALSLNDALEVSLAAFYGALTERGIVPQIGMPERAVVRRLDRTALHRVLSNILNNAVKYSDGDLSVTLTQDGEITFANGAAALDAVQAERLFDRFYTVDSARNATGLGLSIARLLTEKMGGSIAAAYEGGRLSIVLRFEEERA